MFQFQTGKMRVRFRFEFLDIEYEAVDLRVFHSLLNENINLDVVQFSYETNREFKIMRESIVPPSDKPQRSHLFRFSWANIRIRLPMFVRAYPFNILDETHDIHVRQF